MGRVPAREGRLSALLAFVASPRFLDLVTLGVLVEAAALVAYRRRTGRGMRASEVASFLGAGLALLLAMRVLAAGAGGARGRGAFAAAMAAALACHVWHVAQRRDV